jgi:hypothetical protein
MEKFPIAIDLVYEPWKTLAPKVQIPFNCLPIILFPVFRVRA